MRSPYSNPYLSARAKGIFAYYAELGRPVSADEMSAVMPEGRDAIQAAINELRKAGYVITTREQVNGKWSSYIKFTEGTRKMLGTDTGFSVLGEKPAFTQENGKSPGQTDNGFSGLLSVYSQSTINSNTTDIYPIVELLRSSTISRISSSTEKGVEMPWDLDGEETADGEFHSKSQMRRVKIMREAEEATGAVGKIEDKAAMRKAKYAGKGFTTAPLEHRRNKPEEDWNTKDLVSEFASLLNDSTAGELTMQLNTQQLAIWINQMIKKGATRTHMLAAIRMFFDDPRNLNDAGIGAPLWRRFIGFYQSVEGKKLTEEKVVYEDEAFLAHQAKMLKLLGGGK